MLRLRLAALAGALLAARLARKLRPAESAPKGTMWGDTARPPSAPYGLTAALLLASLIITLAAVGWRTWQGQEKAVAVAKALTRGDPSRAPALITKYGCGGCHTIPGAPGADGKVAAPLGGMRARAYVGGVARHNTDTLIRWIVAPQSISPRSAMPVTGISEAEARDVAAFLYTR
jgi:mono/diheme cytochrome c family protein